MPKLGGFGRAGDAGSLGHYEAPSYYWKSYARRKHDVAYYAALAKQAGSVLEYGIGNGRVALPLARAGVEVTGIDLSRPMLKDLQARLLGESRAVQGRVHAVRGDMRRVRLGARFPLVIAPFNALLHLYSRREMEAFLARVHEHLAPGAEFVFDVLLPHPGDLARDPARTFSGAPLKHPETGERIKYRERFEYDGVRQLLVVTAEFSMGKMEWRVPLTQRQYFPAELEALLAYNGFAEVRMLPDFGASRANGDIDSLVFHCRAAARRRRP